MFSACIDPLKNLGKSEHNGSYLMDPPWWKETAERKYYEQEVKRNTRWTYGCTKSTWHHWPQLFNEASGKISDQVCCKYKAEDYTTCAAE